MERGRESGMGEVCVLGRRARCDRRKQREGAEVRGCRWWQEGGVGKACVHGVPTPSALPPRRLPPLNHHPSAVCAKCCAFLPVSPCFS